MVVIPNIKMQQQTEEWLMWRTFQQVGYSSVQIGLILPTENVVRLVEHAQPWHRPAAYPPRRPASMQNMQDFRIFGYLTLQHALLRHRAIGHSPRRPPSMQNIQALALATWSLLARMRATLAAFGSSSVQQTKCGGIHPKKEYTHLARQCTVKR